MIEVDIPSEQEGSIEKLVFSIKLRNSLLLTFIKPIFLMLSPFMRSKIQDSLALTPAIYSSKSGR